VSDPDAYRVRQHPVLGPEEESQPVQITVDGRAIIARAGETIAATMLAYGIRQFRTMPESGRPRGYFCGVGRCLECTVSVDGTLNVMACMTMAREGMKVTTQFGLGEWAESA
jgi:predicted molibdopterin-dependent oxidoreductase YjgC